MEVGRCQRPACIVCVTNDVTGTWDTAPYVLLGPASYVSHIGERPIAITRKLQHAMPSAFFESAALAAS